MESMFDDHLIYDPINYYDDWDYHILQLLDKSWGKN
jgi:hypothetical protein